MTTQGSQGVRKSPGTFLKGVRHSPNDTRKGCFSTLLWRRAPHAPLHGPPILVRLRSIGTLLWCLDAWCQYLTPSHNSQFRGSSKSDSLSCCLQTAEGWNFSCCIGRWLAFTDDCSFVNANDNDTVVHL